MKGKLALFVDHRVPGVAAALIADDHIELLCQKIDHPSLAFVSPVDAHNRAGLHIRSSRIQI